MKFFKKLSKRQRILVGGLYALVFLATAGGVLAAWLFQAKAGSVLGTKAKKLEIAQFSAGSCENYNAYYVDFLNRPEMVPGTRYQMDGCVKPNKPLTSVTYTVENVQYYKFGALVGGAPEVGDSDLADKLYLYISEANGGVTSSTVTALKTTGVTLTWNGELEGGASDYFEADSQLDALVESDATLNGYNITFDLVATGTE